MLKIFLSWKLGYVQQMSHFEPFVFCIKFFYKYYGHYFQK